MILGLDIGGTKLAAGLVTLDGQLLNQQRVPTPPTDDPEIVWSAVVKLVQNQLKTVNTKTEVKAIGTGCGGPMLYPQGIVSPLHIPAWRDFPLKERLENEFNLPVVVDNDAKAFALAEARFGAGRGAKTLLGMIISTGIGGGIVHNGQLWHGASGNAGHIGHVIVELPPGYFQTLPHFGKDAKLPQIEVAEYNPVCECGAKGCVTAYASGQGIVLRARYFSTHAPYTTTSRLAIIANDTNNSSSASSSLTAHTIVELAHSGDPLALRLLTEAGRALGQALASAAALLDVEVVVIGGGFSQSGSLLLEPLHAELKRSARLDFTHNLTVKLAELGVERAPIIGAAALAL
jgi:glucokinase